jgi:hypothetical protein
LPGSGKGSFAEDVRMARRSGADRSGTDAARSGKAMGT